MENHSWSLNISNASVETFEWREFVDKDLPFTVFLSILSVIGTFGNAMVFLTNLNNKNPSNYRTLIQCLALVDFLSCAIGIPGYALMARYRYTIESDALCQVATVFHFYVGVTSLTILSFTAIERYRKTCRPFGGQFSQSEIKIICVCLNIFGLSLSVPAAFTFESTNVALNDGYVIGHSCNMDNDRLLSRLYILIFVFCLLFCVFINAVFYFLIGRRIILQTKRGPRTLTYRYNNHIRDVSSDGGTANTDADQENGNILRVSKVPEISQKKQDTTDKAKSLKGKALYEKSVQISIMFLVCSLLSCASFVPLLVFRCIDMYNRRYRRNIFEYLGPMAAILNRFHVINHVINPIVYCLLNSNFRKECISLFKRKHWAH